MFKVTKLRPVCEKSKQIAVYVSQDLWSTRRAQISFLSKLYLEVIFRVLDC